MQGKGHHSTAHGARQVNRESSRPARNRKSTCSSSGQPMHGTRALSTEKLESSVTGFPHFKRPQIFPVSKTTQLVQTTSTAARRVSNTRHEKRSGRQGTGEKGDPPTEAGNTPGGSPRRASPRPASHLPAPSTAAPALPEDEADSGPRCPRAWRPCAALRYTEPGLVPRRWVGGW